MDERPQVIDLRAAVLAAHERVLKMPPGHLRGFDEVAQISFGPGPRDPNPASHARDPVPSENNQGETP